MAANGGSLVGSNASEVDELKRAWYTHVLNTLQKLDDRMDSVSTELYKEFYKVKESIQKDLYEFKSDLQKEISSTKVFSVEVMEKTQEKINKLLEKLSQRIESLEKSVVKEELVKELNDIKQNLTRDILGQKTYFISYIAEQIEPIKTKITKIEVKLALWAAFFGVIGTILMNLVLLLSKWYFSKG